MPAQTIAGLLLRIQELEERLEESDQLIEAIKAGEVDAFAINKENDSEIYTLESGDYAYRVLVEQFGEGAINVTEDGLIVYTNTCFCEMLKLPYEKVVGTSLYDFIYPDSAQTFKEQFKNALTSKTKAEIYLVSDGNALPVYISLTSLQPKLPTVGMIITDLSSKKKQEKVILEYQNNLEQTNSELRQTNTELASFAYIASHDLQEPLRKIRTFTNLILEKEFSRLSGNGKDYFNRMNASAKRMQMLIEDLLTYSRTNTAGRKFEDTNLNALAQQVKADLKEELQQKQASLEITGTGSAKVIVFQFRQLLHNLINNSLKFCTSTNLPAITISTSVAKGFEFPENAALDPERKYFHLRYADNGIGFEEKYNEKIFELFQRLHRKADYDGTGIGLAIVKKIVDNHRGHIKATGKLNEGAAFDIYVPVNDSIHVQGVGGPA